MTNNNANPDPTPTTRKRRGRSIFIDGPPERGNATAEELTWPVVSCVPRGRSTFIDGPPERGNATAEELTWPVIETGSEVISPPRPEWVDDATRNAILTMLTTTQRKIIELRYFERRSLHEMSQLLDSSPSAIRAGLCLARTQLLELIQADLPEPAETLGNA